MKPQTFVALALLGATLSGCATRASGVAPTSVSASEYSTLQCDASKAKRDEANARVNALSRKQNTAATIDAAGVFLALIPVGSLFGGNVEGELAQAKGEAIALNRRVDIACSANGPAVQN